jgi:D-amino-acid dehydrogenase
VLAAGVWSGRLARTAGVRLPLEGGKGYHVDFEADATQPALPVFLQEAHVTTTPLNGRMRLTGGLDLCGFDMSVDQRRIDAIVSAARRALAPEATAKVQEVWRGLRPCTPDGLPYIGRLRDVDGLVVCAGHAMLGLTLAPVSARIVADLIGGVSAGELMLFDPVRFARQTNRAL